ncbi:MAG TPA: MlaD family protein [Bacteroidia bacterium]|nr:MlaD family protein [Bacteroidia bacterium]
MKYSKEIRTGVVVIVAVLLFIYGFNFLKGKDIFATSFDLYAVYDHVDGLTANNTVQINGFKVGTVRDVQMDPVTNKIVVHFIITDEDAIITKNSSAEIFSDGLLGYKAIRLYILPNRPPTIDGDTLFGTNETGLKDQVSEMVLPLKRKLESLVSSVDSVVTVFNTLLGDSAQTDIAESFSTIRTALGNLQRTTYRLDTLIASESAKFSDIMTKIQLITTNLAANNDALTRAMNNIANITDTLAQSNLKTTIDNTNKTMIEVAAVMAKINSGQGSLGLLVNDPKLYQDLTRTNLDLDTLIRDIKAHPKRYFSVFGRKN